MLDPKCSQEGECMRVAAIQLGYGNFTVEYAKDVLLTGETYKKILEEKLEEQREVMQNGSTEEAVRSGSRAYTTKEWNGVLANFDAAAEHLREQMRLEHQKRYEEQLQKMEDARERLTKANILEGVYRYEATEEETDYTQFSTSKYDVIPYDKFSCYEVFNKAGESVGTFSYADIKVMTDSVTGTQLLISEHGTASYDAMILDKELISGFAHSMGVSTLEHETLTGYTLNKHIWTGIRYLVKDGQEGIGGKLLMSNDIEKKAFDNLADTYLNEYPNLVTNQEAAEANASLEILGLLERTEDGIISINPDGMSYHDNVDSEDNWAFKFKEEYYDKVFEFVKLHRILGTDLSDYGYLEDFFEENDIEIERIWSDRELMEDFLIAS